MEKPLSFLESLISKLKSLALTTTANIRVSAGLRQPTNSITHLPPPPVDNIKNNLQHC